MNVVSLFDGISCGQIALQRAGVHYDNYYASEIDTHAIKVTQHHFPSTVQLGDIRDIKSADLPHIDLICGGFCCQSFSSAGKGLGIELLQVSKVHPQLLKGIANDLPRT